MTLPRLHDGPLADMAPKAAQLARAAAAGLPVPRGVVLHIDAVDPDDAALRELWRSGPTIVRSALGSEDGELHSGAGLGVSIAGVRDGATLVAAIAEISAARGDQRSNADQIIVQLEIEPSARLVVACEPTRDYLEEHDGSIDAFGSGATPRFSGPRGAWVSAAAGSVATILARVREVFPAGEYGLDVELVVDPHDVVHLVQVRPLTAPLHPGWPAFVAAAREAGDEIPAKGTLVLDVEHNPDPLSYAHAWLVRHLARERPRTGGLVPIAGWLYTRVLIRDLAAELHAPTLGPREVVARLQRETLPRARARHTEIVAASETAGPDAIEPLFAAALAAFVAMLDVYVEELIPARRNAPALAPDPDDPLCLRGRADVLDVLPLAWDVASPALGERRASATVPAIPEDDVAAATLLREWDDHLFALGLAPLRAVYLRAAALSGLGDDIFCLSPPECVAAIAGRFDLTEIRARSQRRTAAATLDPPGRLIDGEPAGVPPRWLRGLPIGSSIEGPIAQRRDLAELRASPPSPDSIVVLPALTAPAAVILHELGLRAICCEHGGAMSHAALMARELGLSALLGCRGCTTIPDHTRVILDTRRGVLRRAPPIR